MPDVRPQDALTLRSLPDPDRRTSVFNRPYVRSAKEDLIFLSFLKEEKEENKIADLTLGLHFISFPIERKRKRMKMQKAQDSLRN